MKHSWNYWNATNITNYQRGGMRNIEMRIEGHPFPVFGEKWCCMVHSQSMRGWWSFGRYLYKDHWHVGMTLDKTMIVSYFK